MPYARTQVLPHRFDIPDFFFFFFFFLILKTKVNKKIKFFLMFIYSANLDYDAIYFYYAYKTT